MNPRCNELPPELVIEGLELFNEREFFEAHELLELAWRAESDPIRNLYQGILQIGVGFYHMTCLNYTGTVVKLRSGIELLEPFVPRCQSIEVAPLLKSARTHLAAVVARGPANIGDFDPSTFPTITYAPP